MHPKPGLQLLCGPFERGREKRNYRNTRLLRSEAEVYVESPRDVTQRSARRSVLVKVLVSRGRGLPHSRPSSSIRDLKMVQMCDFWASTSTIMYTFPKHEMWLFLQRKSKAKSRAKLENVDSYIGYGVFV